MLQVHYSPVFLFITIVLTVSSQCTEETEPRDGNGGISIQESSNFTQNSTGSTRFAYGIAANLVAVFFFGSSLVPIKRVETGDGMFFQWVNCAAIWFVAMIGYLILHSSKFHPFAMLGGVIWATGNITVVPVVKAIGLSLGLLIWGSSSLLMGWASARFGWFGIAAQDVARPVLNYCGAGLCLLSGLLFFFVRTTVDLQSSSEFVPLLFDQRTLLGGYGCGQRSSQFWIDVIEPKTRRIVGYLLAVLAGLLYGSALIPILYIKNHSSSPESVFYGATDFDLDYIYPQCCGIFAASTIYFAIYCAVMNNRPRVYSRVVLPGILSGLMWTIATYCWFLANNYLSSVITFPIVTGGYSLVAALWGTLVFKEIKGSTNCFIFSIASCAVMAGSLMTAISKF